ncbi:MAG: AraC family transcriptional regulator [Bacteroidales bacterium]
MVYNLVLLLPCAICLIGVAWFICKRESNTLSQNILVLGFFFSALFFLSTANYIAGDLNSSTLMWWDIVDSSAAMLAIPTMYLYLRSMIHEGRFTWKEYIWFVPALVVGIATSVLYLMMDKADMEGYIQSVLIDGEESGNYSEPIYKLHKFIGIEIYNLSALIQIVGISILAVLGARKYHKRLHEFYSDANDKSIYIDTRILQWFLCTIPLSLALIVPNFKFWERHPIFSSLLFIAWAVVYFALFYYGSQKKYTVNDFIQDLQQADLDEKNYCGVTTQEAKELNLDNGEMLNSQISEQVSQRLMIQFTRLIDVEKIYLKRDLRLDEVARLMFTNRAYVSKIIKEKYKCSFSDYINGKRINFSMGLMRLSPTLTQDKIAEQAGFINAQSYSRAFKKIIGIPPKEWLNRNVYP